MKTIIIISIIISLCFILINLLIYLIKQRNADNYFYTKINDTKELVIAVCNEDISWVDSYANKYTLITVYNKCGKQVEFKSPNIKVIECPNIGSCDYAYLSYIIDRYSNLPNYIEFTKGSIKPKDIYKKCLPCKNEDKFKKLMNFSLKNYNYRFSNKLNSEYDKEKWYNSGYKNMKEWINDNEFLNKNMYKGNICNIIYGGNFCATSKQIYKTPKKIWEKLRSQQKYTREEVDHFIERTWRPLLCMEDRAPESNKQNSHLKTVF